jgi:hypothetical protein
MSTSGTAPGTWIFQASPTAFDLRAALRSLTRFTWLVRTHRTEITPGDRVYLWTAGPDGGVLAIATVLDEPSERSAEPAIRTFMRQPEHLDGLQLRVALRVDHVLERPLLRREIVSHPLLADLTIIRARQGTNFRVTPPQAAALASLVQGQYERSVLICWHGRHVLSTGWVVGRECPLCSGMLQFVRERDLDVDGAMATLIGELPPVELARVRNEARNLLRFEALDGVPPSGQPT